MVITFFDSTVPLLLAKALGLPSANPSLATPIEKIPLGFLHKKVILCFFGRCDTFLMLHKPKEWANEKDLFFDNYVKFFVYSISVCGCT
ncbi:MAG: hypothetical protein A3G49_06340 [Candidatus Sungbacteria bacterium RIFCSPLOWO2_12_FULL_41_11]|uniref:Uncharacterized protein n=1 Tax=Candidatus Sungbacteria bacterium RIFCSPLOWO2_12_FULL_41_11 TaxID=1802286 RepID=A0A1G2LU72_9BACT|nr:MAG: hypothetical protein A3D41_04655 [Candidatus Sungbacteria bacterium RIFCSPHIGHO2_02_FULL_41_12b]OHA14439.1 MAG: hypothetical protein A3G49_06340 [Candidatus Sungbacteria bacterium RIFCSPLOWO2_12_FULL_41_11]